MNVTFYGFSKRKNSTALPTKGGLEVNCKVFEPCSLTGPSFILSREVADVGWSYCYVPAFERYYYINNWRFLNGMFVAECEVDALASWKDDILASQQYVIRSASDFDGNITDALYPVTASVSSASSAYDERPFPVSSLSDGNYVVGIIGGNDTSPGAATYYVFTQSQFDVLRDALLANLPLDEGDTLEISNTLGKMIYNPMQYITSCTWFPFAVPVGGDASAALAVGYFPLAGVTAKTLNGAGVWDNTVHYTVPSHPSSASRGDYLNSPAFSRHVLDLFPFGEISINRLESGEQITCRIEVDCVSGNAQMWVTGDNLRKVYTGQVGVPIQLAQISREYSNGGLIQAALGTGAGIANRFLAGEGLTGMALGAAYGAVETIFPPTVEKLGEQSSIAGYRRASVLHSVFLNPAAENNLENGRPLMQTATLSTLSGFTICQHGDVKIPSTESERNMIESALTTGFYIE